MLVRFLDGGGDPVAADHHPVRCQWPVAAIHAGLPRRLERQADSSWSRSEYQGRHCAPGGGDRPAFRRGTRVAMQDGGRFRIVRSSGIRERSSPMPAGCHHAQRGDAVQRRCADRRRRRRGRWRSRTARSSAQRHRIGCRLLGAIWRLIARGMPWLADLALTHPHRHDGRERHSALAAARPIWKAGCWAIQVAGNAAAPNTAICALLRRPGPTRTLPVAGHGRRARDR